MRSSWPRKQSRSERGPQSTSCGNGGRETSLGLRMPEAEPVSQVARFSGRVRSERRVARIVGNHGVRLG
jgi:hypothetical protein